MYLNRVETYSTRNILRVLVIINVERYFGFSPVAAPDILGGIIFT